MIEKLKLDSTKNIFYQFARVQEKINEIIYWINTRELLKINTVCGTTMPEIMDLKRFQAEHKYCQETNSTGMSTGLDGLSPQGKYIEAGDTHKPICKPETLSASEPRPDIFNDLCEVLALPDKQWKIIEKHILNVEEEIRNQTLDEVEDIYINTDKHVLEIIQEMRGKNG